jgi:hypothetical protein
LFLPSAAASQAEPPSARNEDDSEPEDEPQQHAKNQKKGKRGKP